MGDSSTSSRQRSALRAREPKSASLALKKTVSHKIKHARNEEPIVDEPSPHTLSVSFARDEKKQLSAYEKLVYDAQNDTRFQEEEKAGRRIGFYRIRGDIGLGNFSRVKLGVHLLAREKVAMKILNKTKLDASTQRLLRREISSMERMHHPNIIRLYEVIETAREIYIITEYAPGGDLYTRVTNEGKFTESDAKYFFAQITAAVDHMHGKGIVHRDIKCENLFFVKDRLVKLGDFGFSTAADKDQQLTTFCGSPPYAAPELYRDESYVGIYVDLWAMGILLYFMVTSLMPFRAQNLAKLRESVVNGNYSIPSHVSDGCQELIRCLLNLEPMERWSTDQIRSCPWLQDEHFPKALEPLPLDLTQFWTSFNQDPSMSESAAQTSPNHAPFKFSFEEEVHSRLEALGITSDLIRQTIRDSDDKLLSNRDSINGTYRVILHRLQKQSNPLERDDLLDRTNDEDLMSSWTRSISVGDKASERQASSMKRRSLSHEVSRRHPQHDLSRSQVHMAKVCTIL